MLTSPSNAVSLESSSILERLRVGSVEGDVLHVSPCQFRAVKTAEPS